jgi:hypothetical protein
VPNAGNYPTGPAEGQDNPPQELSDHITLLVSLPLGEPSPRPNFENNPLIKVTTSGRDAVDVAGVGG